MGEGPFVAVIPHKEVEYLVLAFHNFMVTVTRYFQIKVTDGWRSYHPVQQKKGTASFCMVCAFFVLRMIGGVLD